MTATDDFERYDASRALASELRSAAPCLGANVGRWPGLTIYRFTAPTVPIWWDFRGLAIGIVAQGRKALTDNGKRYVCEPDHYLVVSGPLRCQTEVVEASPQQPCLCMVLQIEPARLSLRRNESCVVSTLDHQLTSAVLRFLRSLSDETERRLLAPLYVQEIAYRALQHQQFARTLHLAWHDDGSPIAVALAYIRAHLSEPLTVATVAEQVNLSASAFTRTFRDVTGLSPYQFVKEQRMDRARELLVERRLSVASVSGAVGYTSTSHFIKEFRGRFGATPRAYADAQSPGRALRAVHVG